MLRTSPAGMPSAARRGSSSASGYAANAASSAAVTWSRLTVRSRLVAMPGAAGSRSNASASLRHNDSLGGVGVRPGDRHEAGLALGDLVVARAPALGAVVAEPADAEDDESRVELVQPLGREAEPVEDAGAEVLDEHVAALHQPGQHL